MDGNVIDLASRRAEPRKVQPAEQDSNSDVIVGCPVCENKAFTLLTSNSKEASFPGYDLICTACDTVIDMSECEV
jgi:hypothetical protein